MTAHKPAWFNVGHSVPKQIKYLGIYAATLWFSCLQSGFAKMIMTGQMQAVVEWESSAA